MQYSSFISRLKIGTLQVFFIVAGMVAAPSFASAAVCTPANTTMYTVAHQDDSILFQTPDLYQDVHSGACNITVFTTSGDAGRPFSDGYTEAREAGARAAYANMAGTANTWTSTDLVVAGHTVKSWKLDGTEVTVVFMRMPDGGVDGNLALAGSLEKLWKSTIPTLGSVDAVSSYSRQGFIDTLAALMTQYQPGRINTQDFVSAFGDGDHSDHHATAYFTRAASRAYSTSHNIYSYRGYPVSLLPINVFDPLLTAKLNAFFTYTPFDIDACGITIGQCAGAYAEWLSRQYISGLETGGTCSANTANTTVVSDTSDMTSATDFAVAAYIPASWTAGVSIPGATWIWSTNPVANPSTNETVIFTKQISIAGNVADATITIAADDNYDAAINGVTFATVSDINNYSLGNEDSYNVSHLLHTGVNTLTITVRNAAGDPDPTINPAGLLYKLSVTTNDCVTQYFTTDQPASVAVTNASDLTVTYNGSPKSVAFSTVPAGLPLLVTYNGSAAAPTDAGTYAVVATVSDPSYTGSGAATLTINKADQTIAFGALSSLQIGSADFAVSATASSLLPVTFTASDNCTLSGGTNVHLDAVGNCTITAHQVGDANFKAASDVIQAFAITAVPPAPPTGGGGCGACGGGGGGGGNGPIYGSIPTSTLPVTQLYAVLPGSGQVLGASTSTTSGSQLYVFKKNLARGSRGTDVVELQKFLTLAGYFKVPVTSYFGVVTESAVKAYQKAHKLPPVGIVGPLTRSLLNQGIY